MPEKWAGTGMEISNESVEDLKHSIHFYLFKSCRSGPGADVIRSLVEAPLEATHLR